MPYIRGYRIQCFKLRLKLCTIPTADRDDNKSCIRVTGQGGRRKGLSGQGRKFCAQVTIKDFLLISGE